MSDVDKTRDELLAELANLRHCNTELGALNTESQRLLEALQNSEERFRDLIEGSIQGILILQDAKPVFVNHAYAIMFGYHSLEAFLSIENIVQLAAPRERERLIGYIQARMRGEEAPTRYEYEGRRRDGTTVWVQSQVRMISWNGALAIQTTSFDITERKQTDVALRESEERFRNLTEGSIQGIVTHRHFKPLFANQAYADLFGYESPDDILSMDHLVRQVVAPDEQARLINYADARMQGKEVPSQHEYQGVRQDGSLIWVDNRVRVINWASEPAILSTAFDITERKQTEAALQQQRDWLDVTLTSIGDAVVTTDTQGAVTFLNRVAEHITGWSVQEAYGHHITEVLPLYNEMTHEPVPNPVMQVLEQGVTVGLANHTLLLTREGREVPIADSGAPIYDSTGHLYGVVLVFRDITESQRLERQVQQAQKMQAIGTLAGGIAHEFNNILTIVLGLTQIMLYEAPEESQTRMHLRQVLDAGHRGKDLVHQILAFSHSTDTDHRPTPLTVIVKEVMRFLRTSLPATITIQTHWEDETGVILADPSQIHQIVLNLCANAEHAMRGQEGFLELRVETVEDGSPPVIEPSELSDGPYLRLTVRDTGHGIAPAVLSRIFEPFYTTKQVGEGTGMGLAIVHGIVTSHGGAISVESQVGEGTTVAVYFPQYESPELEPAVPARRLQGTGCILCVDDESAVLMVMELMLSQLGYEVVLTKSGPEALAIFRTSPNRFDLVITDNIMPEMTGTTLLQELRKIEPDFPVIIYTGFTHSIDAYQVESLEIDALLLKPLDLDDLGLAIRQVMEKRRNPVS